MNKNDYIRGIADKLGIPEEEILTKRRKTENRNYAQGLKTPAWEKLHKLIVEYDEPKRN